MKRRIVALLLALVMALGLALPASATDAASVGGDGGSDIVIGGGTDENTSTPTTGDTTTPPAGDSTTTAPPTGDSTTTAPPAGDSTPTTTPATPVDGEDESDTPMPLLGMTPMSVGTPVVTAVTTTATNVPYLDATGASKTCPSATVVEAGTDPVTWNSGWYVVNDNVVIDDTVTVEGDVHLILADGKTLTVTGKTPDMPGLTLGGVYGINIQASGSLTVYGQTGGTGKLTAKTVDTVAIGTTARIYLAGIQISSYTNEPKTGLIINGGTVTASGGDTSKENERSYGISAANAVVINGGALIGISGKANGTKSNSCGVTGDVTLNNGTLIGGCDSSSTDKSAIDNSGELTLPDAYYWRRAASGEGSDFTPSTTAYTHNDADTYVELTTQPSGEGYLHYKNWNGSRLVDAAIATTSVTEVTTGTTALTGGATAETAVWYYVKDNVTITGTLTVTGYVNLILCDGKTLTLNSGVEVGGVSDTGAGLTIYGQTAQTGKLEASYGSDDSIDVYGLLTVNGGVVEATNTGSDPIHVRGSMTVNSGKVIATEDGASIRGIFVASGGSLTFNGGTLVAMSDADAVEVYSGGTLKLPTIFWWRTSDATDTKYDTQNTYTASALGGEYFEITTTKPAAIKADTPVPYLVWDSTEETLVKMENDDACTEYTLIKSGGDVTWNEGWYVVDGAVTINGDVTITGDVHLILKDEAALTVKGCIDAGESDLLSVHGQSTGSKAGKMTVEGNTDDIDGGKWSYGISIGKLYLHGGDVTAYGEDLIPGADKSARSYAVFAWYVTVYGGSLTATGGNATGSYAESIGICVDKDMYVYGGVVKANSSKADGKIGASSFAICSGSTPSSKLIINAGEVTATAGDAVTEHGDAFSHGIFAYNDMFAYGGVVKAYGGNVTSGSDTSGDDASDYANVAESYGIYAGYGDMEIENAEITAIGGKADTDLKDAESYGIYVDDGDISIYDAEVTATGGDAEAYDSAESYGIYAYGNMTVKGDDTVVTATGGTATSEEEDAESYGIHVNGYYDADEVEWYGYLTIKSGTVIATGGEVNGGDDAESYGIYMDDEDMTIEGEDTVVTATGGDATGDYSHSYGIYLDEEDLIIKNGTVTATAGKADGDYEACSYGIYVEEEDLCIVHGTVIAETKASGSRVEKAAVYYDDYYYMPDHYENNWWWRTAKNDPFRVHPDFYAGNAAALKEDYFELVTTEPDIVYNEPIPGAGTVTHKHTRRQNSAMAALIPTKPEKADVVSPDTFDVGIALYVGLGVLSLTGSAAWIGKRKEW